MWFRIFLQLRIGNLWCRSYGTFLGNYGDTWWHDHKLFLRPEKIIYILMIIHFINHIVKRFKFCLDFGAIHKWRHPLRGEQGSAKRWHYFISLCSKMGDKKGEGGDLSLEQKNINSYLITNTYPNENISLIFF